MSVKFKSSGTVTYVLMAGKVNISLELVTFVSLYASFKQLNSQDF